MSGMNRRQALTVLAGVPVAASVPREVVGAEAPAAPNGPAKQSELLFLTPAEYATVVVLGDLIIPADERSGSASDAGVPAFIDFTLSDTPSDLLRHQVRGGLAWLDAESVKRFGTRFVEAGASQQTQILDDIAWPDRAPPELSHGVAFFNVFRDLVGYGFWSSEMGIEDLDYRGNRVVPEWTGCPEEALRSLGVRYG